MNYLSTIRNMRRSFVASFLAVSIAALASTPAFADIGSTLCSFVDLATGQTGSAFATLGVIIVGAGACIGKVSWGMAVTVIVGIAVLFNASSLVGLAGGSAC